MARDFDARNAGRGRAVPMTCRTCEHYDRRESICKSYDLVIAPEEDGCCDWKEASCTGTEDLDARNEKKSRSVCAAMAESADTGKRALSEKERRILDMWPRFEDGEPVMPGDQAMDGYGSERTINYITVTGNGNHIAEDMLLDMVCRFDERVKRPARNILDADGVPIKVGDTVWTLDGLEGVVTKVEDGAAYIAYESDYAQREEAANLTHTRPDSWERLEEAAREFARDNQIPHDVDQMERDAVDLIRRAKALAGAEVE